MRKQLATFAMTALLVTPPTAGAESMMPSDDAIQSGIMPNGQSTTEEVASGDTIQAEIVDITEDRLVAQAENGQELVFLVDDPIDHDNLAVGDKLELRLDEQTHSAVILNVFPQRHEDPTS